MPVFNVAQALLWICNCMVRKFTPAELEAKLALLAETPTAQDVPCTPSLIAINAMFSVGTRLPGANTRGDIQKALQAMKDERPRAASVLQRALDKLARKLLDGKLTMIGRRARQPKTILLKNGAWTSIEYSPGCGPVIDPEIIPAAAFAELRFIDTGDGIEAVPLDYPAREFPCWRDLSVREADVRRLWPIETPDAGKKRGPAPALTESVKARMRQYDPGELAKMKGSEMASTFGASATICYAARRSVQSELKTPCNSE
jgi:hypothetical protein